MEVTRRWAARMVAASGAALTWTAEADQEAILWSQRKGDRSGRIAWQFACTWVGREALRRRG